MMKHLIPLLALAAIACDQGVAARPTSKPTATITLTSVAFADDCGGTPPTSPPPAIAAPMRKAPTAAPAKMAPPSEMPAGPAQDIATRRRCEQTAMQLGIVSEIASELQIKSVEVLDDTGKSLGMLEASKPTRWDEAKATYGTWDEKIIPGTLSISYVLSQPIFVDQWDSRDRTYTVKVVAALGGVDQPLQTTVMVVGRPPPVPT
jgi:hypothetical protein